MAYCEYIDGALFFDICDKVKSGTTQTWLNILQSWDLVQETSELIYDQYITNPYYVLQRPLWVHSAMVNQSNIPSTLKAAIAQRGELYNLFTEMCGWIRDKADRLQDVLMAKNDILKDNKTTTTSNNTAKYLDTPETAEDYSGDAHVTNITKNDAGSSTEVPTARDYYLADKEFGQYRQALCDEFGKRYFMRVELTGVEPMYKDHDPTKSSKSQEDIF